jgi:hydroxymethylglutaryl-CoA synthase
LIGITSHGSYVPASRLAKAAIDISLSTAPRPGCRAVASHDEDATSMGVEAARKALVDMPDRLVFATSQPPYLDKTNATTVHAALGLDPSVGAYDMIGSVRSAIGALHAGIDAASGGQTALVVLSDMRSGLPGGTDESNGGDAAVALCLGSENVIAEFVGSAAATAEFLDRWRIPGEDASRVWEERFGETVYLELAEAALSQLHKSSGIALTDIDHVIVTGTHDRAVRRVRRQLASTSVQPLESVIGNAGCAQVGLALVDTLDRAAPGQTVLVLSLADGADALLFRATEQLESVARQPGLRDKVTQGTRELDYTTFLTWRGMLRREPPRRPDPDRPAAPPAFRSEAWKFGFEASRCLSCATRHLPPGRVCLNCGQVDQMTRERMVDVPATIATFTIDRLAYSLSPPMVVAVLDFDGGGRIQCELTDVDPESVHIGDRVEMTFRRLYSTNGVHNYFWKARRVRQAMEVES